GWVDSVMRADFIDADFVFQSDIAPAVTAGYEHSFNRVLSFSAGLGIRFASSTYSLEQGSAYEYNSNGEIISVDSNNLSLSMVNSFTNLVVPVEVKVLLPLSWGGLYLTAGPEFSFMLGAKYKEDITYTVTTEKNRSSETDVTDYYKTFSMGLGFRLGGEIAIGKHTLFLESGYMGGLTNISENEDLGIKNGEITLLQLGFKFSTGN
ncbi:MAG: outer membrane beta-barrel protein, partial [Chitinispirillaceae bacterium]